jgi:hypothetical protein
MGFFGGVGWGGVAETDLIPSLFGGDAERVVMIG